MTQPTRIEGSCHCGNILFVLHWPAVTVPVRECGCSFCTKHGGAWTSHRESALEATVIDSSLVSNYRFGTETATFHVCTICGVVPFVTSNIESHLYAVVNTNTFNESGDFLLSRTTADFDGEAVGERLARRQHNWISNVTISEGGA